EEDPVLPTQQTEQAAAGQDIVVGRKMAVVCFISHIAGRRNGNSLDYLSVIIGILVEINDCNKVRSHASLVASPDIESLGWLVPGPVSIAVPEVLERIAKRVIFCFHYRQGSTQLQGIADQVLEQLAYLCCIRLDCRQMPRPGKNQRQQDQCAGYGPGIQLAARSHVPSFRLSRWVGEAQPSEFRNRILPSHRNSMQ